ncbi:hypothetical protein [Nocardioides aurantiacus]|uniref:Uncharacterized protein n=1 Tax=Nocardioides aurantiacus TaxID=86796 RepID=A0A3N2CNW8_9ACTN|nr:hypothetical protein [Nocardioides aurantiacus]ROR89219.1 hypothetical protein EDD33_0036 [Nocardioides aurantiacus]
MSYDAAAHAWAAHLRAGGTTPWDAGRWSLAVDPGRAAPAAPSAVHLELLRRLNLAGHGPAPAGLAEVLLGTPRPGRGPVDPPLPWPDARPFGSPAVDPTTVPPELLVRLAAGVVVRLLGQAPDPVPAPAPPARRAWPWRTGFRLHGTRTRTAAVRERLLAAGAVEGGRRPVHLVLGLPLELGMAEHWAGRVAGGGSLTWRAVWRRAASADRLPDPVDVDRLAERLAAEHPGRVHVVVAGDPATLEDGALEVLGRGGAGDGAGRPGVRPLQLARWDLQRRVNRLAPLARGPVTGERLARRLVPVLDGLAADRPDAGADAGAAAGAEAAAVPEPHLDWARRAAADLAARVDEAGYPVHGDPGVLAHPTPRTGRPRRGTFDRSQTLDLTLAACLRLVRHQEGPRR